MPLSRQKKRELSVNAKLYLENAGNDPFIKQRIATIGYDENRMSEGLAMQQKASASREKQIKLRNEKKALYTSLREIFADKYDSYSDDVRLFRSAFRKNIPVKEKLGLYRTRRRDVASYLENARTLYGTLLKEVEILEKLGKFNLTAEKVQSKLAAVDQVEKAFFLHRDIDKAAQDATDENDKDFEMMRDWLRELQDACRIVLKDRPQLLEKVGILVRSAKPAKKKDSAVADPEAKEPEAAEPAVEKSEAKKPAVEDVQGKENAPPVEKDIPGEESAPVVENEAPVKE